MMARACVNMAEQTMLDPGVRVERHMHHALYGSDAQQEGIQAFQENRPPHFNMVK